MSLVAADALTDVLPPLTNACGTQPGILCRSVLSGTHTQSLASGADVLLAKPARILFILLIAVVVRRLINRAIRRVVANAAEGQFSRFSTQRNRTQHRIWDVVDPPPAVRE